MLQKMWHVFSKQLVVANGGIVIVELAHFIKAFVEIIKIRESFFNKPDYDDQVSPLCCHSPLSPSHHGLDDQLVYKKSIFAHLDA